MPSLFERVAGASRLLQREEPQRRAAPQAAPGRHVPLDPAERIAAKEEDLLDIPAFLRRQAN
jgi:hypothetical protein